MLLTLYESRVAVRVVRSRRVCVCVCGVCQFKRPTIVAQDLKYEFGWVHLNWISTRFFLLQTQSRSWVLLSGSLAYIVTFHWNICIVTVDSDCLIQHTRQCILNTTRFSDVDRLVWSTCACKHAHAHRDCLYIKMHVLHMHACTPLRARVAARILIKFPVNPHWEHSHPKHILLKIIRIIETQSHIVHYTVLQVHNKLDTICS